VDRGLRFVPSRGEVEHPGSSIVVAGVTTTITAGCAAFIPARRAARIDPMVEL